MAETPEWFAPQGYLAIESHSENVVYCEKDWWDLHGNVPTTEIIEDEHLDDQTRARFAETIRELKVPEPKVTRTRSQTALCCQMKTDPWQTGPVVLDICIEGQTMKLEAVSPDKEQPPYCASCYLNDCKIKAIDAPSAYVDSGYRHAIQVVLSEPDSNGTQKHIFAADCMETLGEWKALIEANASRPDEVVKITDYVPHLMDDLGDVRDVENSFSDANGTFHRAHALLAELGVSSKADTFYNE